MIMNSKILLYTLTRRIKSMLGKKIGDDFDWSTYNMHYRGELQATKNTYTQVLSQGDYTLINDRLTKRNDRVPNLHPNMHLLYETILQLRPASVLELGCGGGDHLHNLNILSPNTRLLGLDLSEEQLAFLRERHPALPAECKQCDCTLPFPSDMPGVDIAYTQAVIMHMKTGNNHLVALANLFSAATKQVILMENWSCHDFLADINKLLDLKVLQWKKLYFYYRESEELKKPHLMIVSSVPLKYPTLSDYRILAASVGK